MQIGRNSTPSPALFDARGCWSSGEVTKAAVSVMATKCWQHELYLSLISCEVAFVKIQFLRLD